MHPPPPSAHCWAHKHTCFHNLSASLKHLSVSCVFSSISCSAEELWTIWTSLALNHSEVILHISPLVYVLSAAWLSMLVQAGLVLIWLLDLLVKLIDKGSLAGLARCQHTYDREQWPCSENFSSFKLKSDKNSVFQLKSPWLQTNEIVF